MRRRKKEAGVSPPLPPLGGVGGGISSLPAGEGGSGGGRPARAFTPRWAGVLGAAAPKRGLGRSPSRRWRHMTSSMTSTVKIFHWNFYKNVIFSPQIFQNFFIFSIKIQKNSEKFPFFPRIRSPDFFFFFFPFFFFSSSLLPFPFSFFYRNFFPILGKNWVKYIKLI